MSWGWGRRARHRGEAYSRRSGRRCRHRWGWRPPCRARPTWVGLRTRSRERRRAPRKRTTRPRIYNWMRGRAQLVDLVSEHPGWKEATVGPARGSAELLVGGRGDLAVLDSGNLRERVEEPTIGDGLVRVGGVVCAEQVGLEAFDLAQRGTPGLDHVRPVFTPVFLSFAPSARDFVTFLGTATSLPELIVFRGARQGGLRREPDVVSQKQLDSLTFFHPFISPFHFPRLFGEKLRGGTSIMIMRGARRIGDCGARPVLRR